MIKSYKINKDVIMFAIDEIPFIGNYRTGSIIALNEKELSFVKSILAGKLNNEDELDDKKKEWLSILKECDIICDIKESICMNDIEIESIYLHYTNKCNLYCKAVIHMIKIEMMKVKTYQWNIF